ncbi:MAG: N-acetyltransferase [Planctomycetes bacterium]|nr:N-acetyltransferase [Planctomycetota bacterium]MCK5473163.1 N-acetyltransferase [Planctomycetota bacterium]
MEIRSAKISDAEPIYSLINCYAERDIMLFRSMAEIYGNLMAFIVAEINDEIIGCCTLQIIWSDLAEIKSLAVAQKNIGQGVGKKLVTAAVEKARQLGIEKVFALTLEPDFFEKLGFEKIEKDGLPMKVWSDCAKCPKQQNCDETAVVKFVKREKLFK